MPRRQLETSIVRFPGNEDERLRVLEELEILDTPPEESFDRIARLMHMVFDVPIALVSLMDANRQWYKSSVGANVEIVERKDAFCRFPVATGKPLIVPDTTADPRFSDHPFVVAPPAIRFYAGMPLILDGNKTVGTLCAIGMEPRVFTKRDEMILADLAAIVQTGLELRRTAQTDNLTKALTRRGFKFAARRMMNDRRKQHLPLSVIMMDIDHFKRVNDTYGHGCGDMVLEAVAHSVSSALRAKDVFARMGGEEFAILLPATDEDGARAVAEKLRHLIETTIISVPGHAVSVTASFGIASAAAPEVLIETLLERADQALYQAKRAGRNCVEMYR